MGKPSTLEHHKKKLKCKKKREKIPMNENYTLKDEKKSNKKYRERNLKYCKCIRVRLFL